MENATQNKTRWWASKPQDGKIDIVDSETGKVICCIDISDYETEQKAEETAAQIASLPELIGKINLPCAIAD